MVSKLTLNYYHPGLNIAMQDVRNVWLLNEKPVKLTASLHRGSLVFRLPHAGRRISYRALKKGLIKKEIIILLPMQLLPF